MNGIDSQYLNYINKLDDFHYLLYRIAYRTAPTILRLKPATLISLQNTTRDVLAIWKEHNEQICFKLRLKYFIVRQSPSCVLILFYKEGILTRQLAQQDQCEFLTQIGYRESMKLSEKLDFLKKRFENGCPHEIGIFLGFPLHDVKGFIECKGANYLLCRYWKVYQQPEVARRTFRDYDLARVMVMFVMIDPIYSLKWTGKKICHISRQRGFYQ